MQLIIHSVPVIHWFRPHYEKQNVKEILLGFLILFFKTEP